jgi:hypothetical protein
LWTLSLPDAMLELSHESAENKVICSRASRSNITILIAQLTTNQELKTFHLLLPSCDNSPDQLQKFSESM